MAEARDTLRHGLAHVAAQALDASGMDSVGVYLFHPEGGMHGVILNMPDPFPRLYETQGAPIDPVLRRMRETGAPCSTRTELGDRWTSCNLYRRVSGQFGLTGFATLPLYDDRGLGGVLYLGATSRDNARRLDAEGLCAMAPHAIRSSLGLLNLPHVAPNLTARQNDIAALTARGLTNREIAAELATGEAAVRKHLKALNRHFGTHTRTAMAAAWRRATRT